MGGRIRLANGLAFYLVVLFAYLQIVGVLPHVDAKDWDLAAHDRVLVLGRHNSQALRILDQPAPATALEAEEGLRHGALETLQAAPYLRDLGHQGGSAIGLCISRASRSKVLPEKRVVDVTTTVELDSTLNGDLTGNVVGGSGDCLGLQGVVEVGDVGLVMLAMMELHDLTRN